MQQNFLWRMSCGEPLVQQNLLCRASCGEPLVENLLWRTFCAEPLVQNLLCSRISCAAEPLMQSFLWRTSCGEPLVQKNLLCRTSCREPHMQNLVPAFAHQQPTLKCRRGQAPQIPLKPPNATGTHRPKFRTRTGFANTRYRIPALLPGSDRKRAWKVQIPTRARSCFRKPEAT